MAPRISVIGGGIVGSMIAFQLSKLCHRLPKMGSVTVFEKGLCGSGASFRSAGIHFPYGLSDKTREMSRFSQTYYRETLPFCETSAIRPISICIGTTKSLTELQRDFTEPLAIRAPDPATEEILEGGESMQYLACEAAQYADVYRLVKITAATAASHGVDFVEGVAVTQIQESQHGVVLDLSDGRCVTFDAVALAPGPWSVQPPFDTLIAEFGLRVKRVTALHITGCEIEKDAPLIFFPEKDAFLLPMPEKRQWLFSFTNTQWDVDPTETAELTSEDLSEGKSVLRSIAPKLEENCIAGRVFCDTYAPERVPCIQRTGKVGRLVYAGAANGSGYRLAPAIARDAVAALGSAIGIPHSLVHRRKQTDQVIL